MCASRRRAVSATPSGTYYWAPSSQARVPVHNAVVTPIWQLPILPSVPDYWRWTPTACVLCFGKARVVDDENAAPIRHRRPQPSQDGLNLPRRARDEVPERLMAAGIVDPRQHRAHRFARTVAQQPDQIAAKRDALSHMAKAIFKRLQPRDQPMQPCVLCAAALRGSVRNLTPKYMPKTIRSRRCPQAIRNLTQSY